MLHQFQKFVLTFDSIKIASRSRDGSRILVTREGYVSMWVDADEDLTALTWAKATPRPQMVLAPWGAGRGIKGGFSRAGVRS
jgi:hypothetical protein